MVKHGVRWWQSTRSLVVVGGGRCTAAVVVVVGGGGVRICYSKSLLQSLTSYEPDEDEQSQQTVDDAVDVCVPPKCV